MFTRCEWNENPKLIEPQSNGSYRVNRNVTTADRDGVTYYVGETAVMTAEAYAAYVGAKEVETRRENAIIDQYTQELIDGGLI